MTREEFVRAERAVFQRFVERHDATYYARRYRCGCGFETPDAGTIYDHAAGCKVSSRTRRKARPR